MRGTVLGPSQYEEKVSVEFERPGGGWGVSPTQLSRTKLAPEDVVCPPALPPKGNNTNC